MEEKSEDLEGRQMYDLISESFEICRSITGNGVRQTFNIIQNYIPDLVKYEVPSGTKCLDWVVPSEWNIQDAYILDEDGNKIVDFRKNNLHVVGYRLERLLKIP